MAWSGPCTGLASSSQALLWAWPCHLAEAGALGAELPGTQGALIPYTRPLPTSLTEDRSAGEGKQWAGSWKGMRGGGEETPPTPDTVLARRGLALLQVGTADSSPRGRTSGSGQPH